MAITRAQQAKQMLQDGGRIGLFKGAQADASEGKGAMSPGTSMSGGDRDRGGSDFGQFERRQRQNQALQGAGFLGKDLGINIGEQDRLAKFGDFIKGGGFTGAIIRGLGSLFTGPTRPTTKKNFIGGGGDGSQRQTMPLWMQLGFSSEEEYLASLAAQQETEEEDEGLRLAFRANGGIIGGLSDGQIDEMGRQMYGLGKLVKKVTRAVKKVAKSPIGKVALLYAGTGALGNLAGGSGLGGMFKGIMSPSKFLARDSLRNIFTKAGAKNILFGQAAGTAAGPFDYLQKGVPKATSGLLGFGGELSPLKAITLASTVAGALTPEQEEQAQQLADETGFSIEEARNSILQAAKENYAMDFRARGFKADGGLMRLGFDEGGKDLSTDANYKGWKKLYEKNPDAAAMNDNHQQYLNFYERNKTKQAEGSKEPVAKKTMPLLDMGGMEKDYREDGGFVPIGRMEKADDVPARLSKNEFVFTADAVRNAGDGDVDKGAEVMYNMMKNLESGGDVSEESQGLEGARRMFQTSQRLEEVL
mgnify:FL=1